MRFHATFTGDGKSSHTVWLANTFVLARCFESSHGGDASIRREPSHCPSFFRQVPRPKKEQEPLGAMQAVGGGPSEGAQWAMQPCCVLPLTNEVTIYQSLNLSPPISHS